MSDSNIQHQSVRTTFFRYLIPTLIGMMLMSINVVIDGIFVGNGIGSVALAAVNLTTPIFSIIISLSLLIGIGGGALFSMEMGRENSEKAKQIFTHSFVLVLLIVSLVSITGLLFQDSLAQLLGANADTMPYVKDYMNVLLLFGLFMALENVLSVFVRNDGNPNLAMISLVVTSIVNIILNYFMIFVFDLGVKGAALATIIAAFIGLLVLATHFFRKQSTLAFVSFSFDKKLAKQTASIGFPSFLSEMGMIVFVLGYNLAMGYYMGTLGLSAFSIVNYLHAFMFLAFIGIGSSIQPLISYYHGAKEKDRIQQTISIAEKTSFVLGAFFIIIGFIFTTSLVSLFGDHSVKLSALASEGIHLFFIGYLFTGVNFVYMTYYQSIGEARPSIWMTIVRGIVLPVLALLILPIFLGVKGIWLAVPVSEFLMSLFVMTIVRKRVAEQNKNLNSKSSSTYLISDK
ncbi:MATE family efflux transporter [Metabacillus iocasae]|uniref:Multidrug export protein MepA n=1 Tax=Priestia iocasae TaxID=2291674 RepID=A0ABS2QYA6_9BACI|nr:MATE family efflux transporter [Metabacillus iocasae]MBM7703459.1 putative MATE family efflux protein [Metabacillus iocasae]